MLRKLQWEERLKQKHRWGGLETLRIQAAIQAKRSSDDASGSPALRAWREVDDVDTPRRQDRMEV